MLKRSLFLPFILILSGCASLMPSKVTTTVTPWRDYLEVSELYNTVEPYRTTLEDLKKLKFDPHNAPNVKLLSPSDVSGIFYSNQGGSQPNVPEEIQDCLSQYKECRGFEFTLSDLKDRGIGNVWLRWLKFKKDNEVTGSDVVFQFFLKGNMVVYKQLGGTPNVHKVTKERNPLGFAQEPFELIMKYSPIP